MTPAPAVQREARRLRPAQAAALAVTLVAYGLALVVVSCGVVGYPVDNDLDEVGWIVEHLSLARPASLVANQVYPFGLPAVLRLLRPLTGSLLRAALLWQAVAATATLLGVFLLAHRLFDRFAIALAALACAGLLTLPVATSEFADGTATALLIAGLVALVSASPERGLLGFGASIGAAYLFRLHYLSLLLVAVPALVACTTSCRETVRALPRLLVGFLATAWPLLALNLLVFGNPLHSGVSPYIPGHFVVPTSLDWYDFLGTYDTWSIWRLMRERPLVLVRHMASVGWSVLWRRDVLAALLFAPFAFRAAVDARARRYLLFVAIVAVAYVVAIVLPTRFTDRAFVLVAAVLPVFIAAGAYQVSRRVAPFPLSAVLAVALAMGVAWQPTAVQQLIARRENRAYNERVVGALRAHGMQEGIEVFCNDWDLYNLADPKLLPFYDYGGWLLLDPRFAAERPPPRATTLAEWEAFFTRHGLRYAVLAETRETRALLSTPLPPTWRPIYTDARLHVFKLATRAE